MESRHPRLPQGDEFELSLLPREERRRVGAMTIETYIYSWDLFRSTTMPNPPPWPLRFTDAPSDAVRVAHDLKPMIGEILARYEFPDTTIWLKAVRKPGYLECQNATPLLQIFFRSELPELLTPAQDEIRDLLQRHPSNHHDIHVEIARPDLVIRPSLFAIDPEDGNIAHYESVKDDLIALLGRRLGDSWRFLSLCLIGQTEEKAQPAVVVMVDPYTYADWSNLIYEMNLILRVGEKTNLGIGFLPGMLPRKGSAGDPEGSRPGVSYIERLDNGSLLGMDYSIDVRRKEGDVIGEILSLTSGGTTRKGFLTTYRSVRTLSPSPGALGLAERFGLSLDDKAAGGYVFYPLEKDVAATRAQSEARISKVQHQFQIFESDKHKLEVAGSPTTVIEAGMFSCKQIMEGYAATRKIVESMPFAIGQVRFASGNALTRNKKRIMDWAFVELSESSLKLFKPIRTPNDPCAKMHNQYGLDTSVKLVTSQPLDSFGKITKGSEFLKTGRLTGRTAGVCNGVLATCNWHKRDMIRFDSQGNQVEGHTEEFIIFSKKLRSSHGQHEQTDFCAEEDSGSLVIDELGKVCGLLYGAVTGFCGPSGDPSFYAGAGLVMSMDEVTDSIKMKLSSQGPDGFSVVELGC
ncbi:hypothetical protein FQN54_009067 [Arachnomyces sp. PD_36]|nr:hypothetical protein FQN54_009067 [Arachnomyces sp. PD_36]